jgi:RNA chaperone Hfq
MKTARQCPSVESNEIFGESLDCSQHQDTKQPVKALRKLTRATAQRLSLCTTKTRSSTAEKKDGVVTIGTIAESCRSDDEFFEALAADSHPVLIYLVNGIKLSGRLVNASKSCLFLSGGGRAVQVVFKNAISTVVPENPKRSLYEVK